LAAPQLAEPKPANRAEEAARERERARASQTQLAGAEEAAAAEEVAKEKARARARP